MKDGDQTRNDLSGDAADSAAFDAPTRALVLVPVSKGRPDKGALAPRSSEARVEEAVGLARAIDLEVVDAIAVPLASPRPATLFGSGKVEELKVRIADDRIGLVIVDGGLSPAQQRNLEKEWKAKVIDRTGLILEIFGERAHTKEGALQVELAHLNYQRSRLVRSWTHLERQRGGFGFLGGPGETQIEADRRALEERTARIEKELETVVARRRQQRKTRKKGGEALVALVGYTNAGKSTLFNVLTRAGVFADNRLFATLDPTLRQIELPHGTKAVLSDTVGFVSQLPTTLVAAFRATLEEVADADLSCTSATSRTPTRRRRLRTLQPSSPSWRSTHARRAASSRCGTRSTCCLKGTGRRARSPLASTARRRRRPWSRSPRKPARACQSCSTPSSSA